MIAVVTGANAGLGFQIAVNLARMGNIVVMACRSVDRARQSVAQLLAEVPDARTMIIPVDVSEPESIREFGRQFFNQVGRLDLLINNAGVVGIPLARNSVGHELQLATNYLGAFALTGTLLPFFRPDGPARVVNVGSLAHRLAKLDLDDINWEKNRYGEWRAYARSKLAMLTFTMELNRRLGQSGSNIIALGCHPGFASTNIGKDNRLTNPQNAIGKWLSSKMKAKIPSPDKAAIAMLVAACADDARGGEYYGPGGWMEIAGETTQARLHPAATDIESGKRLWALSESMTGVSYLSDY